MGILPHEYGDFESSHRRIDGSVPKGQDDIVAEIRKAQRELNQALRDAANLGMRVDIDHTSVNTIGGKAPVNKIELRIYKEIGL